MEINNWIVIHIFHERYFFSAETRYCEYMTLNKICEENNLKITDLEERQSGFYMYDKTRHKEDKDLAAANLEHIYPEVWLIMNLDKIDSDNDYNEYIFGKTNMKFGLLDKIKGNF